MVCPFQHFSLLTSHYDQKLTNHYTGDWFLIQCTKKGDMR